MKEFKKDFEVLSPGAWLIQVRCASVECEYLRGVYLNTCQLLFHFNEELKLQRKEKTSKASLEAHSAVFPKAEHQRLEMLTFSQVFRQRSTTSGLCQLSRRADRTMMFEMRGRTQSRRSTDISTLFTDEHRSSNPTVKEIQAFFGSVSPMMASSEQQKRSKMRLAALAAFVNRAKSGELLWFSQQKNPRIRSRSSEVAVCLEPISTIVCDDFDAIVGHW